jgi:hypothetical protein
VYHTKHEGNRVIWQWLQDLTNEINEVMGQSYNIPEDVDEQDLFAELDALEGELQMEEVEKAGAPSYLQVRAPGLACFLGAGSVWALASKPWQGKALSWGEKSAMKVEVRLGEYVICKDMNTGLIDSMVR